MTDFDSLGRYHAALDRLERGMQQRNSALNRAGLTLTAASQPPVNRYCAARSCPFDACERLLAEGRVAQRPLNRRGAGRRSVRVEAIVRGLGLMNRVFFGDCRDTMRKLIADGVRVQMCVTSPPYYGLRDYGHPGQLGLEETPAEYVAAMVEVFALVRD